MSDEQKQAPEPDALQFDTAEPAVGRTAAATALSCAVCKNQISTAYYEVNGAVVCASCRGKLNEQLTGGSGSGRFAKAVGLGLLAAAAGSALYYAILALTGYEIGLVAIAVGFLVGKAVNRGSQGRGGRAYQVLAVGLTYFAIVTTYIPFIVKGFRENPSAAVADSTPVRRLAPDSGRSAAATATTQGAPDSTVRTAAKATGREASVKQITIGQALIGLAALLAIAAAAPVLAGFENIIGMVIIAFALFEAWRLNARVRLAVTGPYRVGAAGGREAAGGRTAGGEAGGGGGESAGGAVNG
jgi:hypothetical protein